MVLMAVLMAVLMLLMHLRMIEHMLVSMPHELKSCPSTSPTHTSEYVEFMKNHRSNREIAESQKTRNRES